MAEDDGEEGSNEKGMLASPQPLPFPLNLLEVLFRKSSDFIDYIKKEDQLRSGIYQAWHLSSSQSQQRYDQVYVAVLSLTQKQKGIVKLKRYEDGSYAPEGHLRIVDKPGSRYKNLQISEFTPVGSVWERMGGLEKIVLRNLE